MPRTESAYELTPAEKRDLIRLIEQGRPLPEKYRFLLFEDKREVELVWAGKTREVCTAILPFQALEHIDEPRKERSAGVPPRDGTPGGTPGEPAGGDACATIQPDLLDLSGRQVKGWTNKLIWGDNKLILSSLKAGALRRQIEDAGGLKLIYIDPPFDVGADFSMDIEIGGETFHKEPNLLEQIAYRDTWGRGADSFIAMIYERLILMRDLMHSEGSIYVHCDWRVAGYVRLSLDEVFGKNNFVNEIIWKRTTTKNDYAQGAFNWPRIHETLLYYAKDGVGAKPYFKQPFSTYDEDYVESKYPHVDEKGRRFGLWDVTAPGSGTRGHPRYEVMGVTRFWRYSEEKMKGLIAEGRIIQPSAGAVPRYKRYLDEMPGVAIGDVFADISPANSQAEERVAYPTQKPEALLERVIQASSNEGDLVADFFCGSGTTAAVAEKLGRKWIATDLGKFGIHTTRKRLIQVQRELKAAGKPFRAFEVLNLGRYERQAYLNVGANLPAKKKAEALARKEQEFRDLILRAYRAEPLGGGSNVAPPSPAAGSRTVSVRDYAAPGTTGGGTPPELAGGDARATARVSSGGGTPPEPAGGDARATRARLGDEFFHGKAGNRLVVVGPINLPVGRLFIEEVIRECRKRGATRVDVLAFEFEMGLFPAVLEEAKRKGLDIAPKTIPPEVFDRRAVEKGQVRFHDVAYIEVTPRVGRSAAVPAASSGGVSPRAGTRGGTPRKPAGGDARATEDALTLAVELTDFSVYYTQGISQAITAELKAGKSEVVCEAGQLIKISKDKHGIVTRQLLTQKWTDWVDYWAVDFDYESRKEIIQVPKRMGVKGELPGSVQADSGEFVDFEERWTGAYIFENE